MKRIAFLLAAFITLAGCASAPKTEPTVFEGWWFVAEIEKEGDIPLSPEGLLFEGDRFSMSVGQAGALMYLRAKFTFTGDEIIVDRGKGETTVFKYTLDGDSLTTEDSLFGRIRWTREGGASAPAASASPEPQPDVREPSAVNIPETWIVSEANFISELEKLFANEKAPPVFIGANSIDDNDANGDDGLVFTQIIPDDVKDYPPDYTWQVVKGTSGWNLIGSSDYDFDDVVKYVAGGLDGIMVYHTKNECFIDLWQ